MLLQVRILIAIVVTGIFYWGYHTIGDRAITKYQAAQAVVQAKLDKAQQDKYNKLAAEYEVAKTNREVVFKTHTRTVERIVKEPAYQVPCITDEGVEVVNKALEGIQ